MLCKVYIKYVFKSDVICSKLEKWPKLNHVLCVCRLLYSLFFRKLPFEDVTTKHISCLRLSFCFCFRLSSPAESTKKPPVKIDRTCIMLCNAFRDTMVAAMLLQGLSIMIIHADDIAIYSDWQTIETDMIHHYQCCKTSIADFWMEFDTFTYGHPYGSLVGYSPNFLNHFYKKR